MTKRPYHVVFKLSQKCTRCGATIFFSTDAQDSEAFGYDAYFCMRCDVWLESACNDPACSMCAERPKRPSEVPFEELCGNPSAAA